MHGLFGSKQNNRSISKYGVKPNNQAPTTETVARAIARELDTKVYAIDLRNHGESPHDALHDYESMALDVEEFISQHHLAQPVLIGHSMGAKVAMTVALRSPSQVGALVSVDNAPVDAMLKSDFAKYVRGMKKIIDLRITKQTEADEVLKHYEEALPIRQFLLTNLTRDLKDGTLKFRIPIHTLAAALDKMGDFPFKDPDVARYDGPTLVVRGTRSHYVPDEVIPIIGRFFPLFEIRDVESGHWVISEKPESFKKAVIDFLRAKKEE